VLCSYHADSVHLSDHPRDELIHTALIVLAVCVVALILLFPPEKPTLLHKTVTTDTRGSGKVTSVEVALSVFLYREFLR
jgi:hypothetical protein